MDHDMLHHAELKILFEVLHMFEFIWIWNLVWFWIWKPNEKEIEKELENPEKKEKGKQPSRPKSAQPGRAPAPPDRRTPPVSGSSRSCAPSLSRSSVSDLTVRFTRYPFAWLFYLRNPLVLGNQPAVLCFSAQVPGLF
jgi:hypothetical protein